MLIRFKVSNFLSFEETQEISMIAGATKKKEHHLITRNDNLKLLKFSALYGANASGKSNLIKAVQFSKSIILNGIRFNCSNLYCRIKEGNRERISSFDFEIEIDNQFFTYGFDILLSKNSLRAEWLYRLDKEKNKEILVFSRRLHEDIKLNPDYFNNNPEILNRIHVYHSDTRDQDTSLFLTIMNRNKDNLYKDFSENNVTIFKEIYNWFSNALVIIFPQVGLDSSPCFTAQENLEKINCLIPKFGTGIKECEALDSNLSEQSSRMPPEVFANLKASIDMTFINSEKDKTEPKRFLTLRLNGEMYLISKTKDQFNVKKIVLKHKNNDGEYLFSEESDGTKRLFELMEILTNKDTERVYFVDELDRCFHPELTYEFVNLYLNSQNNSQLIVSTHESRLLNFDLLRRDEIWFANREKNSPTELYPLEKYNERFDRKTDKAYLEGRYGGIPVFETPFSIKKPD